MWDTPEADELFEGWVEGVLEAMPPTSSRTVTSTSRSTPGPSG